eukprot:gene754-9006_t
MNFREVNPVTCSCDCFDGKFKGIYQSHKNSYKYIYFNWEFESLILFSILLIICFFVQKSIERIIHLAYEKKISFLWLLAFVSTLHPHIYGWWATWNYINDRFYILMIHQIYFNLTEMLLSVFCLFYMQKSNEKLEIFSWATITIALTHIIQSLKDQGFDHLKTMRLWFLFRDFGFLIGDFTCLIISIIFLWRIKSWKERFQSERKQILAVIVIVSGTILFLSTVTFGG